LLGGCLGERGRCRAVCGDAVARRHTAGCCLAEMTIARTPARALVQHPMHDQLHVRQGLPGATRSAWSGS
jgi:hypothetical protein